MGFFSRFKQRTPDLRTLGKWLWNNDVSLLQQMLQNATLMLLNDILDSRVVEAACANPMPEDIRGTVAGQLVHLLDGRALLKVYDPVTSDETLRAKADSARRLVVAGEYPNLCDDSILLGTLLAIHLWYAAQFTECIVVANHLFEMPGAGIAEVYRVRGFAHFALKDYDGALADLLEARKRRPGLVGLSEPIAALARITKTAVSSETFEPEGVRLGRLSLLTFSRILWAAGSRRDAATESSDPLHDYRSRAQEVDAMLASNLIGRPQVHVGDVVDFAKCAMSAKLALMDLLSTTRQEDEALPSAEEARAAFGYCMLFLDGTRGINTIPDASFSSMVEDCRRAFDALFTRLDELKFRLP